MDKEYNFLGKDYSHQKKELIPPLYGAALPITVVADRSSYLPLQGFQSRVVVK